MREADRPVLALDDVRGQRGIERALPQRPLVRERLGRCPERGHETERIARSRREAPQAHTDEAIQRLRHGKRLAAGRRRPRARGRSRAQRRGSQPTARGSGGASDARMPGPADRAAGDERAPTLSGPTGGRAPPGSADSRSDGSAPSTSRRARRTRTFLSSSLRSAKARAPADDGSSHWTSSTAMTTGSRFAQRCQGATDGDCQCAVIDRIFARFVEQKRDLERTTPRRRESRQHVVEHVLEEIAEPRVGEAAARPLMAAPRERESRVPGRAPRRRARASTCRSRARLRARARSGHLRPAPRRCEQRRAPFLCRRSPGSSSCDDGYAIARDSEGPSDAGSLRAAP